MSLYLISVPQFVKLLRQLDRWLDKAISHAQAKNFDPEVLLAARLAPDQFPLLRQVQSACDTAKLSASRLVGKSAPVHPDTETTIAELKSRIEQCTQYLETLTAEDFAGAESRPVPFPGMPGKVVLGAPYLIEFGLPNFYFHLTTAYAILRHNGVDLGKRDFIGGVPLRDA